MLCPKCSEEIEDDSLHCRHCGVKISNKEVVTKRNEVFKAIGEGVGEGVGKIAGEIGQVVSDALREKAIETTHKALKKIGVEKKSRREKIKDYVKKKSKK